MFTSLTNTMQEKYASLTVIGVVTTINMISIGVLGFPVGFFTGSSKWISIPLRI